MNNGTNWTTLTGNISASTNKYNWIIPSSITGSYRVRITENVFYGYYFSAPNNRIGITSSSPALNEWYHIPYTRDTNKKIIQVIVHDKTAI